MTRYNVLVINVDDSPIETIDRMPALLARVNDSADKWTRFTSAHHNTPICGPSRASVFTGQLPSVAGCPSNADALNLTDSGIDPTKTLMVALQRGGYRTGMFGKYQNGYPWDQGEGYIPVGWDRWFAFHSDNGSGNYYEYAVIDQGVRVDYTAEDDTYSTDLLFSEAESWVAETRTPWFCYVAPKGPHSPYIPASRHADLTFDDDPYHRPNFNPADISQEPSFIAELWPTQMATSGINAVDDNRRNMWRMLQAVDEGLDSLLDSIDLANTVVIFMADNAYMWGEHRHRGKGPFFEESTFMSLAIRHPEGSHGSSAALAATYDLAPTVAETARVHLAVAPDGQSLLPILLGDVTDTGWRSHVLIERAEMQSSAPWIGVRTHTAKYVWLQTQEEEASYDLVADPYEMVNQGGNAELREATRRILTAMAVPTAWVLPT